MNFQKLSMLLAVNAASFATNDQVFIEGVLVPAKARTGDSREKGADHLLPNRRRGLRSLKSTKSHKSSKSLTPTSTPTAMPSTSSSPTSDCDQEVLSFENGEFGCFPYISTGGDGEWEFTTTRADSGLYSIRSPNLDNEERMSLSSNLTWVWGDIGPDAEEFGGFPGGLFILSLLAGGKLPFDLVRFYVDGVPTTPLGHMGEMTDFERQYYYLPPNTSKFEAVYLYNPFGISKAEFPEEPDNRIGAVFIDDFDLLPWYDICDEEDMGSFESGYFECYGDMLSTGGDGDWEFTTARAEHGRYSVRSPNLVNAERTPLSSNLTFSFFEDDDDCRDGRRCRRQRRLESGGRMYFHLSSDMEWPFDTIEYYIDGIQVNSTAGFGPGRRSLEHESFWPRYIEVPYEAERLDFVYKYNPLNISKEEFPEPDNRMGVVYVDAVDYYDDMSGPAAYEDAEQSKSFFHPITPPEGYVNPWTSNLPLFN